MYLISGLPLIIGEKKKVSSDYPKILPEYQDLEVD
jgi:hypothetical protein